MKKNFQQKVLEKIEKIPKGKIVTYKILAKSLNSDAYRAVGSCLAKNKNPEKFPCHRVVRSDGKIGDYAFGGEKNKSKILKKEGINIKNNKIVEMEKFLYKL